MRYEISPQEESLHYLNVNNDDNMNDTLSIAELLNDFSKENSKIGYLAFKIETALGTLPVPNAEVTVSKPLGNGFYLSKVVVTDIDGKTETIALPAVSAEISQAPGIVRPYSVYNASVSAPGFFTVELFNIPIFENITALQPINLFPDVGVGLGEKIEQIYNIYPTGPQTFSY
ncbi:hypothetical protein [Sinanaerobacter sp. ZZT-01]|uniref:hypothetical protein n=1 Tax=Sinanaerobacter sp. ZZT-01 TaxID=3111540 RepID=UPI002D7845F4|nr:hypothetical protein [Sinanaerobacter sp. ZZT-01]WRR92291.1 hypothetical protein U5921_09455 [Sinanaerobacter sp. ZZT-01]